MIQFYRGTYASYNQATHGEGIYFATDKGIIKMGNKDYIGPLGDSTAVKNITLNENGDKFIITFLDNTSKEIEAADPKILVDINNELDNLNEKIKNITEDKAEKSELPTKTSDLTNDSGFITINDVSEITAPTKTSELINDSGFITTTDLDDNIMWVKAEGESGVRLKGTNGTATGNLAISAGDDKTASDGTLFTSEASGDHAVAFGYGNICAGRTTLALGLYNTINGSDSVAFGQRNLVNGNQALSAGLQNEVTARLGVAIGYKNKATNTDSIAIGYQNTSSGSASIAMGDTCEAKGASSTAMGYKSKATGAYSSTFGKNTQATNEGEVAMGLYNKSTTSTDMSKQTAFSFGIGSSDTNRANALEIKKNGDIYIGDKLLSEEYITETELSQKGFLVGVDTSEELDDVETNTYVKYVALTLTDALKLQVRENIGVSSITENTIKNWGFTKNTGTYSKPSTGIPKTDLDSSIQTSLEKADTALQSEQYKGTITGVSANGTSVATNGVANIPEASTSVYGVTKLSSAINSTSTSLAATASAVKLAYDLANGKQDVLISGTNIKTINGQSILGDGNISNLAEKLYVDEAVKNVKVDLTGYATEEYVNNIDFYNINNNPIVNNGDGKLLFVDENGYIGMKISSVAVYAKDFIAGGHKLSEKINKDYVDNSIAELVDGAPETLNTLNELASALKDNADIVDVLNQSISSKQDTLVSGSNIKTINGESLLGSGDITISGAQVQSDWNETNTTSPAYIANKPNIYMNDSDVLVVDSEIATGKEFRIINSELRLIQSNLRFSSSSYFSTNSVGLPRLVIDDMDNEYIDFVASGDGTKFLSNDGTYKTLYTTTEIDNKIGDINTILESIING